MKKDMTDGDFAAVLKAKKPVLVDFWAPWCGPCRAISKSVEAVAKKYEGRAFVVKVNVDDCPKVSQDYGIKAIPTLLVFKNGAVVGQLVGGTTQAKIEALLDKAL